MDRIAGKGKAFLSSPREFVSNSNGIFVYERKVYDDNDNEHFVGTSYKVVEVIEVIEVIEVTKINPLSLKAHKTYLEFYGKNIIKSTFNNEVDFNDDA